MIATGLLCGAINACVRIPFHGTFFKETVIERPGFDEGTNNAFGLAAMLRQLAVYHAKDPNNLFMVRLAQGLTPFRKRDLDR
ncbi:26S proteasome non-ATPase regulatory subunit 2 [Bulinus truncatus]|nr:26S proteasome non-ATPase regulatory subunit 2 [Bulinus truncatus]